MINNSQQQMIDLFLMKNHHTDYITVIKRYVKMVKMSGVRFICRLHLICFCILMFVYIYCVCDVVILMFQLYVLVSSR